MSRRANLIHRCERCRLHRSLCICDLIPRIETRTKLLLVIHRAEDRKPTNTGRLAAECLVNSEVVVRGNEGDPPPVIPEGAILLFPADDAIPLTSDMRPTTLVVPDGNWRQAARVRQRVPGLSKVPCVTLPPGEPSIYRLRSEAHAHGLATLEAIARAYEILEGRAVREALEHPFRAMVERTLWVRGSLADEDVTTGVPEGVSKHEPARLAHRQKPD